ncbi:MAG: DUF393 domain-containing protein [bacterium]|nr:DUF393 domain-containing protein [bacterium]
MADRQELDETRPVLIYDGNCPICRKTMAWITENADDKTFEMLTCQSEQVGQRFPFIEREDCMQAMQLILPDGEHLVGEKAMPEILKRMNRYGSAARLFQLPGADLISRRFYRWFADNRYQIAKVLFPEESKAEREQQTEQKEIEDEDVRKGGNKTT